MSVAVTVLLGVRPGEEAAFLAPIRENARASRAGEPGCRRFDVCTAPERPGQVFLCAVCDDAAAAPILADRPVQTYRRADALP